jgi:hypothetical protein
MRRSTLLYAVFAVLVAGKAWAVSAVGAYNATLPGELDAFSGALCGPLGQGLAYAAGAQDFAPADAKPALGFNLGVGAGLSVSNIDKAVALAQGMQSNRSANPTVDITELTSNIPSSVPVGLGQINAHLGLPFGFDVGLRYDQLDATYGQDNVNLQGYTAEIRHNLLTEGLITPVTLTLGAGYSRLFGSIHVQSSDYNATGTYDGATLGGSTHTSLDAVSDINVYSVQATLSRSLVIVTPYLGVKADSYSGGTKVTTTQDGNVTLDSGGGPVAVNPHIQGSASQIAPSSEVRVGAGLKFNLVFVYLELGGEYGLISDVAAGHAQIGAQFR